MRGWKNQLLPESPPNSWHSLAVNSPFLSKLTCATESDKKHCPHHSCSQGCDIPQGAHLKPPTPNREAERPCPGPLPSISLTDQVHRLLPSSVFISVISSMHIQQISLCSLPPTPWDYFFFLHSFMKIPGLPFPWDCLGVCAQNFPKARSGNRIWDLPNHSLYHGEFVFSATQSWIEIHRAGVLINWGMGGGNGQDWRTR